MYVILLIGLVIITIIAFYLSHYELLSPMTLVPLGFVLAAVLALIGTSSWNHVELQWNASTIIMVGCIAFVSGCYCVECFPKRSGKISQPNKSANLPMSDNYVEAYVKYAILVAIILGAIILRVYETYRLGNQFGLKYQSYADLATQVRQHTASFNSNDNIRFGVGFSVIERQMEKIGFLAGYISVFLLISNLMNHTTDKRRLINVALSSLSLLASCIFVLVCGVRANIMYYCMAALLIWFVLVLREKKHTAIWLSMRLLLVLIPLFFIAVVGFYVAGKLIGRVPSSGPVEYISFYLGAGIPSLQWLLDHIGSVTDVTGSFTLHGIYSLLYKVGIINDLHVYSIQWVNLEGHNSNIFTMFGRYYLDFGWLGVIILSALSGVVYTFLYRWAKHTNAPLVIMLFAWMGVNLFDMAREEYLFSRFLSSTKLVTLALLILSTWIMTTSFMEKIKKPTVDRKPKETTSEPA